MSRDKRIDAYISKAAPFAQPILNHLRELVHATCPEVEETIKWGFPHYDYCGQMLCSTAAFKAHAAVGFWKASLLKDPNGILNEDSAMGHLGRITSVKDLPSDKVLKDFLRQAMRLNEEGITVPRKNTTREKIEMPEELETALRKNKAASSAFTRLSPSHQQEYFQWIAEAKTAPTKEKRVATTLEWVAEGKGRNWKYERK